MTIVDRAIKAGGGLLPLSEKLGVRYQALQKWRKSGRVPAERVISLEAATGVPRHELRPDIYPEDSLLTTRRKRA